MKTFTKILSLAVVGYGMISALPAKADTYYHRVYHTNVAADDPFSILDKYQNNVLTAREYNNGALSVPISAVDTNRDGFVTRQEFYANYRARIPQNATDLNLIMPAAGGYDDDYDNQCRPQF
jgi:hypothetical protein